MNTNPVPSPKNDVQPKPLPPAPKSYWKISFVIVALVAGAVGFYFSRTRAVAEAPAAGATTIAVIKVTRENLARDLVFDAEFRPYQEIDLHAKVAGYLESIPVDIGDTVKAGQLLGTLEIPELQNDLEYAKAVEKRSEQDVKRAEATYHQAHLVYTRLAAVDHSQSHLIAQQDIDAAQSQDASAEAALASSKLSVQEAETNVRKLETTVKYSKITAPFPGVITKRFVDPGALIQAGTASSTQSLPLVRLSELDRLRVNFPISSSYVDRIHVNDAVEIRIQSTGRKITAKVSRLSGEVDMSTRTMEAEVDVENADLTLLPGMYASVLLHPDHREQVLVVPIEAVSRKGNPSVSVVTANGEIEQRAVTLGLETSTKMEILSGLKENDMVMIGNRGEIKPGQKVDPKIIEVGSL